MEHSIRLARLEDAQAISDIYNYYVEHSTCTYQLAPESLDDRSNWLMSHDERHPVTVATHNQQVVGWASLSEWNPRAAYAGTAEISVYIHHAYHRQGLGRGLLVDLISRAKQFGYHTLIGGASSDQTASLALQASLGFEPVACFREVGYKFDTWLDVTYLQLMLPKAS